MTSAGELAALLALGAFHGINPGMGWLFAVALGMQEGSRRAVLRAIPPIVLGHAAAVIVALAAFESLRAALSPRAGALIGGGLLVGLGMWHLARRRHPSWVGMRLQAPELAMWSFVMASAHGAGLMLLPVVSSGSAHPVTGLAAAAIVDAGGGVVTAAAVHTAGMLVMMTGVAVLVYDLVGVSILRRAWFNLDVLWWVALVGAGFLVAFT